jgi:hypothetical protein
MRTKSLFRYLGTMLTYQNLIQEDIKNRLKSDNVRCHFVENLMFSSLLSKNIQIKVYRSIILPLVFCECKTWSLT